MVVLVARVIALLACSREERRLHETPWPEGLPRGSHRSVVSAPNGIRPTFHVQLRNKSCGGPEAIKGRGRKKGGVLDYTCGKEHSGPWLSKNNNARGMTGLGQDIENAWSLVLGGPGLCTSSICRGLG